MKRSPVVLTLFISTFSFCQDFGIKEKEELVFLSLKSDPFVNRGTKDWPVIYVLVDTMDLHIQNFIKKKFPNKNWRFFDIEECQVIFKDIAADSLVSGFQLSMWKYKEGYYFDFAFKLFSRIWHSSDNDMPIQPYSMCGDLPTGRLFYDKEKKKWGFANEDKLYREDKEKRNAKAPDRNHCLPTDDNGISFSQPATFL